MTKAVSGDFECVARCGDAAIADGLEQCDDGNQFDGDGCSSQCTVEYGYECVRDESGSVIEPLKDAWGSQPFRSVCDCIFCGADASNSIDWFTFDAATLGLDSEGTQSAAVKVGACVLLEMVALMLHWLVH